MFLKILILIAIIVNCTGYMYLYPPGAAKSNVEGFCLFERDNLLIKTGDSKPVSRCERATCSDDYSMSVAGCGITINDDEVNCSKIRDWSKPYPYCCEEIICKEEKKIEEINGNSIE